MRLLNGFILLFTLLLTGCASQYSISEQQLSNYLNDEMHLEIKEGNRLFGVEMKVNDVSVTLGHKVDVMAIRADSLIKVNNPLLPLDTRLTAQFEAKPWYDASNHGVYLKELKLIKVSASAKDVEQTIAPVAQRLMRFLTHYLETQPVYILDTEEGNQALLAEMTKRIQVTPGKLKLIFTD